MRSTRFCVLSIAVILVFLLPGCLVQERPATSPSSESSRGAERERVAGDRPRSDLVVYWPFDEGQGSTASDASGAGLIAEFNGNATWTTGSLGPAVHLDGTRGYINIPHDDALVGDRALTYVARFRLESYTDTHSQIVAKSVHGGGAGRAQLGISVNSDNRLAGRAETRGGRYDVVTNAPVETGTWHDVALVFSGDNLRLYHDGIEAASLDFDPTALLENGDPMRIGCDIDRCGGSDDYDYLFHGDIDEVRIYRRALTADEVAELAADL